LSKRNVKLILKILSDLEPLRGSSSKKTLYSTSSCVNWALYGMSGPLKRSLNNNRYLCIKGDMKMIFQVDVVINRGEKHEYISLVVHTIFYFLVSVLKS
jgi:hypothetical protein